MSLWILEYKYSDRGSWGVGNLVEMRLFPLGSSSNSGMENQLSDRVKKNQALLFLNVYDLTPVNDYLYWFGVGIFHSGIEGSWVVHCTTLDSSIFKFVIFKGNYCAFSLYPQIIMKCMIEGENPIAIMSFGFSIIFVD